MKERHDDSRFMSVICDSALMEKAILKKGKDMWKKYIAMGIVSVLLLTNIPGTVYAAEPTVNLEEQPEENIPDSMSEEPSAEEIDESEKSENKEQQESGETGEGETDEELSDSSENLASEEIADVEEIQGQENQVQEDEQTVPQEQSDSLDVQSTEGEYLPYDGAKYRLQYIVEEDGITITDIEADNWEVDFGQLVIPTEIEGKQVVKIAEEACRSDRFSGDLVIPSSITTIERSAFYGATFDNLVIGMKNIPDYLCDWTIWGPSQTGAFNGCTFTGNLVLQEGVVNIEKGAFRGCSLVDGELVIPNSVINIGEDAFSECKGLTAVQIPDSVKKIGTGAFRDCSDLRNIEIPASVEEIGARAFVDINSGKNMPKYITILGKNTVISENALSAYGSGCSCFVYGYKGSTAEEYAKKPYSLAAFIPLETPEVTEHRVTTSQELLDAIDSYRHIILADGIYEIPASLKLEGVISLTIEAENPGKAEILSKSTTVPVVITSVCKGIEINGCILGHESVWDNSNECGTSEAYVVSGGDSVDVTIKNCDLYGCGTEGGSFSFCENISIENCVIRDCMRRIASVVSTNNLKITNCTISGNAYKEELAQICEALSLSKSDVSFNNSLFLNNFNFVFDGNRYSWDTSDENRYELQTVDCNFYSNAWDGETPGTYGICLNGITWQMDGDTLKIGYPLQLGTDKVIQSEKGSVLPYSDSSLPWKNCSYQQIDVAEGVEYDRGNGVTVNTSGADMEVKVPMTSEEYQNLLTGILTQEEIQAVEEGQGAEVEIVVADGETVVPEKDKQTIEDVALNDGYTIGKYLDITMYIQVGNDSKRAVEQTNSPVCLVLGIPAELQNDKRNFAVLRMHNGKTDLLEDLDQNPSTVTIETTLFSTYALAYGAAEGISGNVSSFGGENEEMSLQLVDSSGTVVAETQTLGRKALYKLENVPAGSYTLRAEKKNHVSRDYSVTVTADRATVQNIVLWLTGDVNGDGKVNAKDKKILYNHIAGSSPLTDYTFLVGDVNRDGRINAKDKKMVYNHIAGNALLWN